MKGEDVKSCLKASAILAISGAIIMFCIGFFYECQEYSNYLKKKAEVETEVAEWKQEMLAMIKDREEQKSLAFSKLSVYIETNRYLSQDFADFQLRYGLNPWFRESVVSFARSVLKSNYYNDDIRKMGMLLRNYEAIYVPNNMDIMREEQQRLSWTRSFDEYRKHLPDKYSFLRKEPSIKIAFITFICILFICITAGLTSLIFEKK